LDKSNLVQYSFTLGTSCRQQKKKIFYPASWTWLCICCWTQLPSGAASKWLEG
jgi:hypothetical protein